MQRAECRVQGGGVQRQRAEAMGQHSAECRAQSSGEGDGDWKLELSFAFTTQQPSAVDQRILAQADTIICHKLTVAGDLQKFRENLKCSEPADVKASGQQLDLAAWIRSLDRGHAIVSNTDSDRLFSVEFRPRVCPHGGTGFQAYVEAETD